MFVVTSSPNTLVHVKWNGMKYVSNRHVAVDIGEICMIKYRRQKITVHLNWVWLLA